MKKITAFILSIFLTSLVMAEAVWIDVRTIEEYKQNHIEGDIQIAYEQIVPEVEKLFPDKNKQIYLYCRSGRRAGIAMTLLKEAGYTHVSNMGGINDARKARAINQ